MHNLLQEQGDRGTARLEGCYSETVNRDGAAVESSAEARNLSGREDAPLDEEHAPPSGGGRASNVSSGGSQGQEGTMQGMMDVIWAIPGAQLPRS